MAILQRILIGAWLAGWAVGEYHFGRLLALGLPDKSIPNVRYDVFSWWWLLGWTFGGVMVIAKLYSLIFARPETVTLKGDEISVSYSFGRRDRFRRWEVAKMGNMRVERVGNRSPVYEIRFAYEGKNIQLLPASDWASTQRVLDEMRANGVNR